MTNSFAKIAFTKAVREVQEKNGSREFTKRIEQRPSPSLLDEAVSEFLSERDSFYMATVNEDGWPYVQHKGGPVGFIKMLDEDSIAYADFRGNRQYISVGNLSSDNRVSMILVDYPNRTRLKLMGTAEVVEADENPELVAKLECPSYKARVEQGVVIRVEAIDWNCPQHITPRYTVEQFSAIADGVVES